MPVMSCGAEATAALPAPETSSVGHTTGGGTYLSKMMNYSLVMGAKR